MIRIPRIEMIAKSLYELGQSDFVGGVVWVDCEYAPDLLGAACPHEDDEVVVKVDLNVCPVTIPVLREVGRLYVGCDVRFGSGLSRPGIAFVRAHDMGPYLVRFVDAGTAVEFLVPKHRLFDSLDSLDPDEFRRVVGVDPSQAFPLTISFSVGTILSRSVSFA